MDFGGADPTSKGPTKDEFEEFLAHWPHTTNLFYLNRKTKHYTNVFHCPRNELELLGITMHCLTDSINTLGFTLFYNEGNCRLYQQQLECSREAKVYHGSFGITDELYILLVALVYILPQFTEHNERKYTKTDIEL
jgi:hypothetical protein